MPCHRFCVAICEGQESVCCWVSAKPKCLLNWTKNLCLKHDPGFPHHGKFWASPVAALGTIPAFLECRETSVLQFMYQTYCVKELFFCSGVWLDVSCWTLTGFEKRLVYKIRCLFLKILMNNQNAASPSQAEFIVAWLHYHGMKAKLAEMEIFQCLLQSSGFWVGLLMQHWIVAHACPSINVLSDKSLSCSNCFQEFVE